MLKLSSIAGKTTVTASPLNLTISPPCASMQLDHAAEVTIEQAREFFGAFRTLAGQRFGQRREAGDIGKENGRRETFDLSCMRRRGFHGLQCRPAEAGRHVSSQCL